MGYAYYGNSWRKPAYTTASHTERCWHTSYLSLLSGFGVCNDAYNDMDIGHDTLSERNVLYVLGDGQLSKGLWLDLSEKTH